MVAFTRSAWPQRLLQPRPCWPRLIQRLSTQRDAMPWTSSDAKGHTKKADTPEKQKKWAKIANAVLDKTGDEATAIKEANAAMRKADSAPRGWNAGATDTRFADVAPQ